MKLSTEQIVNAANEEFSRFAGHYGVEAGGRIAALVNQKCEATLNIRQTKNRRKPVRQEEVLNVH